MIASAGYRRAMQDLELGMPTEASDRDLPQADYIRINGVAGR